MDFSGFFFSLIIQIYYPHLAGDLKGPPSPLQELEVGGCRPLYLLVKNIFGPLSQVAYPPHIIFEKSNPIFENTAGTVSRGVQVRLGWPWTGNHKFVNF